MHAVACSELNQLRLFLFVCNLIVTCKAWLVWLLDTVWLVFILTDWDFFSEQISPKANLPMTPKVQKCNLLQEKNGKSPVSAQMVIDAGDLFYVCFDDPTLC